ncbi:MAG TPA: ferritin-like domain-containing protein [Terriglobales bacterium]|nr:ferritin-like domain-containing protein [Terriglobales bacterium]
MQRFVRDVEQIRRRALNKLEEGAVTAGYKGDVEQTISILNEALATEIVCVLRYMHHYFMATGVHGKSVADEFKEHADSEREHADSIAERIQQLGGKPDFNPRSLLERSASQYVEGESLAQMIREDLIAERVVIEVYQDMIRHFGSDDPTTRVMMEKILHDEEEHASDLADLLYIADPTTGETQGKDPGADPLRIDSRSGDGSQRENRQNAQRKAQPREGHDLKSAAPYRPAFGDVGPSEGWRPEHGSTTPGAPEFSATPPAPSATAPANAPRSEPRRRRGRNWRRPRKPAA